MPDPGLTQAQFDEVFDRELEVKCVWNTLREFYRRFTETKVRIQEIGNTNAFTSAWNFTSFDIKSLTDGGNLYIRIADETPGAAQAQVSLYRDTSAGAGDLVAQGSAADGGDITLAEQNSSNIVGSVTIGTVNAAEADDNHYLIMQPDFPQRVLHIFDGGERQDFGAEQISSSWREVLADIASSILSSMDEVLSFHDTLQAEYLADKILANENDATGFQATTSVDSTSGTVTVTKSGLVEDLRRSMVENTTAQTVLEKVPTAGSVTAESTNRGALTFSGITLAPGARAGTVTIKALVGGTSNFGSEECVVFFKPTNPGGSEMTDDTVTATNRLVPDSTFRSPSIGLESIAIVRSFTKTGDGSNVELAAEPVSALSGENTTNTDNGKVYVTVTGTAPNLVVKVYNDSGAAAANLVAQSTGALSTGAAYTAAAQNNSGLTLTGTTGSAPTAAVVTLDANGLESDSNDGNVPDFWSFAISDPASSGTIQEVTTEMFGASAELNETSGTPTIPDGRITRGGVHPLLTTAS